MLPNHVVTNSQFGVAEPSFETNITIVKTFGLALRYFLAAQVCAALGRSHKSTALVSGESAFTPSEFESSHKPKAPQPSINICLTVT